MVRHDKTGALGIVIDRPVEERPLANLLDELGNKDPDAKGKVRIYAGGPWSRESVSSFTARNTTARPWLSMSMSR